MDTFQAIRERRTIKDFTGEPVGRDRLEALLELATWAPNHRMTEPWRFAVVESGRIAAFAAAVVGSIRDDDAPKLLRKRAQLEERLPRVGAFVAVHRTPVPEDPLLDREDYAACCCAVQNLMLGATALGLGSFWSTGKVFGRPPVRAFLRIPDTADLVGSIWLGIPAKQATSRRKPWAAMTSWSS